MKLFKNITITLFIFSLLLSIFSISSAVALSKNLTPKFVKDKIFTFRLTGEPTTLDWSLAYSMSESYIIMNLMEGLLKFDSKFHLRPALASSWKRSSDGKTYTFYIRPGVKWSDGKTLSAHDFVFAWKRLLSPTTAASYAYFLFDIAGAEDFHKGKIKDFSGVGVKAIDNLTLQVNLHHTVAHWAYLLCFWSTFPLRQDIVEKYGTSWSKPGRIVTVGPFTLASYDIGSKIELAPNPHYYANRGNIEKIVALIIEDETEAIKLYKNRKIDFITDIDISNLNDINLIREIKYFDYLKVTYLGVSLNHYPISNVNFRRAIAMAMDKTKFVKLLGGKKNVAYSFVPPGLIGYSNKIGLKFNPTLARSELKKSNLDNAFFSGIEFLSSDSLKSKQIANFIKTELKNNIGVDININSFENKKYRTQMSLNTFHMVLSGWGADYPDPDNFLSVFLSDSGNNRTLWKDKRYDELVRA